MPDRTEVIERLRQRAAEFNGGLHDYDREAIALLTQAADLLEAGESRVEYRVAGDSGDGDRPVTTGSPDFCRQAMGEGDDGD